MAGAWQQPFLNVFRYFRVHEWKRSSKEGDVALVTDKTLKSSVYRIRGSASASNYIQLPRTSTQSLGLTGRYLYLLLRPLPAKHFAIHLDVATEDGQVIRMSFSSLFKEFKSSATWLQFPFIFEAGLAGVPPAGARWTCLQLDLRDILLVFLSRGYGHLKSVRLCASLLVRNLYTSDLSFDPAVSVAEARRAKLPVTPVPREMAFPVPQGERWQDHYAHVRFPSDSPRAPPERARSGPPAAVFVGPVPQLLPPPVALGRAAEGRLSPGVRKPSASGRAPSAPGPLPEVRLSCGPPEVPGAGGPSSRTRDPAALAAAAGARPVLGGGASAEVPVALEGAGSWKGFLPDPVLRLKGVIGFGGQSAKWALWTADGAAVVYPCHAVIVALHVGTGEQRFFLGHTDKVSALALDGRGVLLASAQALAPSVLRLWGFQAGDCLSLSRSPAHTLRSLSFSSSGAVLCGVGQDRHGRTVVVVWGTGQVGLGGEVAVLAKVHTDFDIQTFRVAFFDETRMASCGRGSVRLWRLRGGVLRSCPVDLGEHCALELTDLAFAPAPDGARAPVPCTLLVSSRGGHVLEIDGRRLTVRHTHRLLPARPPGGPLPQKQACGSGPGLAISSLAICPAACAVGSEDGHLRLWSLDFSSLLLETEHEGPVSSVCVSPDGQRVLCATSSGHLGFLDIPSREYTVLARSHTAPVLALSLEPSRGQLATVSLDHTVRIWDLATRQQLYDFTSPAEAPCAVAFHPSRPAFFCGFSSGAVRSFSLDSPRALVAHACHQGAITGLAVSPDGSCLFSSCSRGSLVQYGCAAPQCHVLRVAANTVCQDLRPGPGALAVSRDGRLLAFVGPCRRTVTVVDAASLDELLRIDVGTLDPAGSRLDSAIAVCFGPSALGQLLVSTSSRVVVLDTSSGRTVRELPGEACSALVLSEDARLLLVAMGRALKVWNYSTQADPGCQVYIGHSEPVQAVAFAPGQQQVLSVGDAIFLWDVLAAPESDRPAPRGPPAQEADPGPGTPEGVALGASGLPRPQEPVPAQAPPAQPGAHAGSPQGSEGTPYESGEGGPCEQSCGPRGLRPAPGLPVLMEQESPGAGDPTWGSARGSRGLPGPPLGRGWPSSQGLGTGRAQPPARPDSYTHFLARSKASALTQRASVPPSAVGFGAQQLCLKAAVGYNGNGRANVIWRPDTGFFAYSCGRLVVVEDLHSGAQQHWLGHPEEISTLALSHASQVLASASCRGSSAAHCQIRVWAVPGGLCRQVMSCHSAAVQALAFSPDDKLLASLGDYGDRTLALWSTATFELVSCCRLSQRVHAVAFSPWSAGRLAAVGAGAVSFWRLQQHGADTSLQVHREPVPEVVGAAELTSLCYGAAPLLYCGSSSGQVCVWDTRAGRCFLAWEADDGEIGVLLCSGPRLVSGSSTERLRLWAVGAVPELRRKGSGARSSSVFMERELTLDGAVVSASFDSSMDMGVVGTTAGTLWYISWAEGTSTRLVSGHRTKVNEVAFSPGESHCATCGEDGSVRVWSLASLELVVQFQVLQQSCLCLAWSPPSCGHPARQQVAAGYGDGTLRLFSIARTAMELKMHPHRAALTAVAFSTDGQTILSGDQDGLVAVSRPRTGITFRVLSDHRSAPISAIQSTSKQSGDLGLAGTDLWLAASGDQRVSVWASDWPRDRCELLDWLSFPAPTSEVPGLAPPCLAAFCPWDAALLVCVGLGAHKEVLFYSLRQKQVVDKVPLPCFAMSLSPSRARLVAVGFAGCTLRLLDCASGTAQDFAGHDDLVHLCRFAPSARLLFTAAHNEILVWEVVGH